MNKIKRCVAMMLVIVTTISLVGCNQIGAPQGSENNTELEVIEITEEMKASNMDFALRLLQTTLQTPPEMIDAEIQQLPPNALISPISVYIALAMTVNGANGDTLTQMEEALGLTRDEINSYAYHYWSNIANGEQYKLHMANSIWYTDDEKFTVKEDFVKKVSEYYGADVYAKDFSDPETVSEINAWVEDQTEGYIKDMINRLSEDDVMILLNALAFEAKWDTPYSDTDIRDGIFTFTDGATQTLYFMDSEESLYLEDEKATGFIKYYADKKYAFVALLPNEGIGLTEYVCGLDSAHLWEMIQNPTEIKVYASIPQFEVEDSLVMNDILESMGITDAFHYEIADFSNLGEYEDESLYINKVLHKTYLEVNQDGTKGAASTAVIVDSLGAAPLGGEVKTVYLNRPFMYMIIDCENNQPIFMGTFEYGTNPRKCGTVK